MRLASIYRRGIIHLRVLGGENGISLASVPPAAPIMSAARVKVLYRCAREDVHAISAVMPR